MTGQVQANDDEAFFESKIRPVLVEHCYECHSSKTKVPKGGLRVDSRVALLRGGDSGPALVPGKPEESLIVKALSYTDSAVEMPPKAKLPDPVLADFRLWVAKGAIDPRNEVPLVAQPGGTDPTKGRDFWAFQVPKSHPVPAVKDSNWPRTDVDHFLLAKLESKGLKPVADADRYTWLRRVSIDLTGLPPTPEQITEYIADTTPQANERVVDRLLASAAFGERWARHWLDLTGYADQIGTANDLFAEHAWKYRDYTIAAFNSDKPFDQFIREQIAGDLLPYKTVEERASKLIATGFLLLGDLTVVEADKAKLRIDVVDQQIDKVSKAFLGLTVSCARCHDHKFDPISQRDYYALGGIFNSTESVHKVEWGVWSWPVIAELPETDAQRAERESKLALERQRIEQLKAEREQAKKRKTDVATALNAKDEEEPDQPTRERLETEQKELDVRIRGLDTQIPHAEFFAPAVPAAFAVHDYPQPADMQITIRGNAHALGEAVPRGVVEIMSPKPVTIPANESGRRQLADWLISPDNPLTARVTVNRIWQKLFGEGLVRSVDYFGVRGELPSHPELLDYLATRFVADAWSQKRFIRNLALSRAYQLSSVQDPAANAIDPDNRLLWRMHRRRLDAESLRDSLLVASGHLMTSAGGPGLPLEYPENTG
ncbi:MAG: Planctomycete cytochrome, partial [Planctomycetaceae bacterium]|nr:Planctomycete cytochrome [Planctomycetaceae bacterium]